MNISPQNRRATRRCIATASIAAAAFAALTLSSQARAQSIHTWNGGGANDNWSTTGNWVSGSAPDGNDEIHFAGTTRLTPNRDNTFDGFRIFFDTGAGAFTLGGNALTMFDFGGNAPKIENTSTSSQTINMAITLNGAGSGNSEEINPVNGNLTFGSTVTLQDNTQLKIFGNNGNTVTFNGIISGTGSSISVNEGSYVTFSAANSYTGDTFINAGTVQYTSSGSSNSSIIRLGDSAVVGTSAALALIAPSGGANVASTIVFRAGATGLRRMNSTNISGTNTYSGNIFLDAAALVQSEGFGGTMALSGSTLDLKAQTMTLAGPGNFNISGTLQNAAASPGVFVKGGTGVATLSANNTYGGATTIRGGSTNVAGAAGAMSSTSGITINSGTLAADNTTNNNTNRINDSAGITLNGGALTLVGKSDTNATESVGAVAVGSGAAGGAVTIAVQNGTGGATSAVLTGSSLSHSDNRTTVNFVGINGTLGSAGNNPRIIFTTAPTLTNGVIANTAGSVVKGWATVNGTDFAGYDNTNGVVAVSSTTVSGALADSPTVNALINANSSIGGSNVTFNTLKISTASSGQTLDLTGAGSLGVNGILLTGSNDFTIRNTGAGTGAITPGSTIAVYVDGARTLTFSALLNGNPVAKSGPGILVFGNTGESAVAQALCINGGAARASGTTLLGGALRLRGGVLEADVTSGAVSFTRPLGTTAGSVGFGAGGGGFSAFGTSGTNAFTVDIGGAGATLSWGSTANFLDDDQPLIFGSVVSNRTVNFTNPIALNSRIREIQVNGASAVMNGTISGSTGRVVKTGVGTLIFGNSSSYGGTTITAGTLQIGNGGTTGQLGDKDVQNNAALTFNRTNTYTAANNINGTGSLYQIGTGTTVLSGDNSYTGTTSVLGGVLSVVSGGPLGAAPGSPADNIFLNGGTLWFSGSVSSTPLSANRRIVLGPTGAAGTGSIGVADTKTVRVAGVLKDNTGGTGNFGKEGLGTLILEADATYSGTTTIAAGTLQLGNAGTSGSFGGGAVTNNGSLVFNRTNTLSIANSVGGSGNVYQAGSGTTVFSGSSNYSGTTTISSGRLLINGSITGAGGAVSVNGGTLGGSGSVSRNVNVNTGGTISPGNSMSNFTINTTGTTTTFAGGGAYSWEMNKLPADGAAGTNWDLLTLNALSITANSGNTFTIKITSLNAAGTGAGSITAMAPPVTQYRWTIATSGSLSGFAADAFAIDSSAFTADQAGSWSVEQTGNNLDLIYTVPEPSSVSLLAGAAGLMLRRRRRVAGRRS